MAEIQRQDITARIKQARTEAGLTQDEMAEALDVKLRTYWNYEDSREGKGRVPWALLDKIAEITGKTSEWLIHGDTFIASTSEARIDALAAQFTRIEQAMAILPELQRKLDALLTAEEITQASEDDAEGSRAARGSARAPGRRRRAA